MKKWVKVYTTQKVYNAKMATHLLDKKSITNVLINKMDSSYNNFGYYEVLVYEKNYIDASKTIDQINPNE